MGCGASKSSESLVAPPQAKEKPSQSPQELAAAPALPENRAPPKAYNGSENDIIMPDLPGLKTGDSGNVAGTQCVEQETLPERPESTEQELAACTEYECPPSSESENPAREAFRAHLSAREADDFPPSPVAFKSSRSLNRSIGVRRRTTDQSLQPDVPAPDPPALAGSLVVDDGERVEKEDDKDPDPLRENFELTKETNPLLVVRRNATGNGILSCKASEKSLLKSHKRLAVGFALDDSGGAAEQQASGGTAGAALISESGSSRELDPDDHIEAERIASLSAMLKEVPAPVVVSGES
ncbi:hypothetical protein Vretimale_3411 [Volvox reticuliferus]|uniref:Uncharacterized protein n=1 Tax=Volvox reticuliferus TaxID=1737510 RepID=A0A8J4FFP0_9CHLO|nr:hypothetical protein Vretifemale_1028 [Volvox reticuliferus]GIL97889.1 hypothetical protein Vretimale_3411 [Volvox reticuliferus]